MFFLGFGLVQQVHCESSFATQLACGIEPRVIYQNGRMVGRGIELNETVNGRKHFFSHAETGGGTTEVDAWSDTSDHPATAKYSMQLGNYWVTTSVQVNAETVEMKRESSEPERDRELTFSLPKGKLSMLAQFDPLKLFPAQSLGKTVDVAIIDPVALAVGEGTLVEQQTYQGVIPTRAFDLTTAAGSSQIVVSQLGKIEMMQDTAGQVCKPAAWDSGFMDMVQRAGIRLDAAMLADIKCQPWTQETQTSPTVYTQRRRG